MTFFLPLHPLEVPVLPVSHEVLVEGRDPLGVLVEADAVAGHGVPRADRQDVALVILQEKVDEKKYIYKIYKMYVYI